MGGTMDIMVLKAISTTHRATGTVGTMAITEGTTVGMGIMEGTMEGTTEATMEGTTEAPMEGTMEGMGTMEAIMGGIMEAIMGMDIIRRIQGTKVEMISLHNINKIIF